MCFYAAAAACSSSSWCIAAITVRVSSSCRQGFFICQFEFLHVSATTSSSVSLDFFVRRSEFRYPPVRISSPVGSGFFIGRSGFLCQLVPPSSSFSRGFFIPPSTFPRPSIRLSSSFSPGFLRPSILRPSAPVSSFVTPRSLTAPRDAGTRCGFSAARNSRRDTPQRETSVRGVRYGRHNCIDPGPLDICGILLSGPARTPVATPFIASPSFTIDGLFPNMVVRSHAFQLSPGVRICVLFLRATRHRWLLRIMPVAYTSAGGRCTKSRIGPT